MPSCYCFTHSFKETKRVFQFPVQQYNSTYLRLPSMGCSSFVILVSNCSSSLRCFLGFLHKCFVDFYVEVSCIFLELPNLLFQFLIRFHRFLAKFFFLENMLLKFLDRFFLLMNEFFIPFAGLLLLSTFFL